MLQALPNVLDTLSQPLRFPTVHYPNVLHALPDPPLRSFQLPQLKLPHERSAVLLLLLHCCLVRRQVGAGGIPVAVAHVEWWVHLVMGVLFVHPGVFKGLLGCGPFVWVDLKEKSDE